jgi:serine/threonine kinase PknH
MPRPAQTPRPWAPDSAPPPPAGQPSPQYYPAHGGSWASPPPTPPQQPPQQFAAGPTAWNQPPPKAKRSPWPIIAAVAVVLVLIVGGVGIWLVIKPKPAPPPEPISSDRLSAMLLTSSEVNSLAGASNMEAGKPTTAMDNSSYTLSLPKCQGALYPVQGPAYVGTGYQAVSGLVYRDPKDSDGNYHHIVDENVVSFPTADKAKAFVQGAQDKWKACAGQPITITTDQGKTYRWTFGQINGDPPKFSLTRTQESAEGWACQHAISAANNIVVDIDACDYKLTNQGSDAAEQIVAKIDKA